MVSLRDVFPARTFASESRFAVWVERPDGSVVKVGGTPATRLAIPQHRAWWVSHVLLGLKEARGRFGRLLDEVTGSDVPGIVVEESSLRDRDVELLAERAPQVRVFGVSHRMGSSVTPRGLEPLASLPRLERLRIGCRWFVTAPLPLAASSSLLEIVLLVPDFPGEALSALPASLERFTARGCRSADVAIDHLSRIERLRELALPESDLSDAGFKDFAERTDLGRFEALDISGCARITAKTTALLARMLDLARLDLGGASIDDRALEPLALVEGLERLSLGRCRWVTDRGLEHLRGCARLRELVLQGTSVSAAGIDAFLEAVPGCRIVA